MLKQLASSQAGETTHRSAVAEILDAVPVAVYTTDADGYVTSYNEAAQRLWGIAPELGRTRWSGAGRLLRANGETLPIEECTLALSLKAGAEMRGSETIAERPDGSLVHFIAHPRLLRDAAGKVTGAVNTLVDVTAERHDRNSQPWLAAIITSSHDAIVSKDLNGVVTSWNAGARRVFGYEPEEMVGKSVTILIPADRLDEETLILDRIRRGEVVDHFETIRVRKDGTRLPVSLTISPIRAADGAIIGVSKIARDISERRESERRIGMLMREVNHRVKNQFAVILSMIRETSRRATDIEEFDSKIGERIMALSRSHDLLVQGDWRGVNMFELLVAHLRPAGEDQPVTMSGPSLTLQPMAVQYLGIAFQELVMNSVRFGALSGRGGKVSVEWSVAPDADGEETFSLSWTEKGTPAAEEGVVGFGHVVLTRLAPASIDGTAAIVGNREGLVWSLQAPLRAIEAGRQES